MNAPRATAALVLSLLPLALFGQAKPETIYIQGAGNPQRSFTLVVGSSVVTISGEWHSVSQLARYAHDHTGTYLVFTQDGELRRLDNPERVKEAEKSYAPMRALAAKQQALAAVQRPLAESQRGLSAQQGAATDPREMGRIGVAQGALGAEQGVIGAQQGEIGQQQPELGRAFYNRIQAMLSACVADGSCPPVTTEAAQR